ncbi:17086_t:CDS:2 [Cetraspora pellucida]|uniref:ATP-dependent DNA helicase n=1 Tax=Cetraspora pellucida TaxID=1433469 RepID=A0A9N9E215_9GLOM|nr:17086_t:CDS:2 [Cetraspora pellucida]
MLANQSTRNGNECIDHFLFQGYESNDDFKHPQCNTHIQLHRKRGTERIIILNACKIFLNNPLLSPRLRNIIDNIELIHRCSEESDLDREFKKKAKNDPLFTKIQRITRSAPEYNSEDEYFSSDNDNAHPLPQDPENNLIEIDPILIIRNGLKDLNAQNDNNDDDNLPSKLFITPHHNKLFSTPINTSFVNLMEKFATGLNEKQKKAYFFVCDHHRRNQPANLIKPSQLLLFLSGADMLLVLAPTGIAATNIYGYTIHSACGFGFETYKKNNLAGEHLKQLQEIWSKIQYVIIDKISMIESTFFFAETSCNCLQSLTPHYVPNKITTTKLAPYNETSNNNNYSKQNMNHKNVTNSTINNRSITNAIGRNLWLSVNHVIELEKPMRQINDHFYASLLENMRKGNLNETQKEAL